MSSEEAGGQPDSLYPTHAVRMATDQSHAQAYANPAAYYDFDDPRPKPADTDTSSSQSGKKSSRNTKLWVAMCVGFAILFIALVGVSVYLGVVMSDKSEDDEATPAPPAPRVLYAEMTKDPDFEGSFKLTSETWNPDLSDRGSAAFRHMASEKETEIDRIFRASNISGIYDYSVVTEFRQGSVVVLFLSKLRPRQDLNSDALRVKYDYMRHNPAAWMQAFRQGKELLMPEDDEISVGDFQSQAPSTPTTATTTTSTTATTTTRARRTTSTPPAATTTAQNYRCGDVRSLPGSRIVGGRPADSGEYPWMAFLRYSGNFICGGSVIDPLHILTAAHCVVRYGRDSLGFVNGYRLDVLVGKHERDTSQNYRQEQRADVAKIYMHNGYVRYAEDHFNDIALIRLQRPLTFNSRVSPVCLPTVSSQVPSQCVAAGWGTTVEGIQRFPTELHTVTMQAYNHTHCSRTFSTLFRRETGDDINRYLNSGVMCAANFTVGGKDTCQGDSGGPLFCLEEDETEEEGDKHYTQYGVTSWGKGCGDPGKPGFYTYMPSYLDWLENTAKPNLDYVVRVGNSPCLNTFCLDLLQRMSDLEKPALCRLLDLSMDCMVKASHLGGPDNCTRDNAYDVTIAYLNFQMANGRINDSRLLDGSMECREYGHDTDIDICNDPDLLLEMAKTFCNFSENARVDDLCLRVLPQVDQCVQNYLVRYDLGNWRLGNCSLQEVTSSLAAASPFIRQKDSLCSAYCPDFNPENCLGLLNSSYFMLNLNASQQCSVWYEAIRCVRAKQELAGRPCEEHRVRSSIARYLGQTTSTLDFCGSVYPRLSNGPSVCSNGEMLDAAIRHLCAYSSSSVCRNLAATSACLARQTRYLTTYCPAQTIQSHLSATYSCDLSGRNDSDAIQPNQQCTGQSVADALSQLATDYCDVIANRLNVTWTFNESCGEVTDLLRCVTRVANHKGYRCTEQDVVTLTPIMTRFPVDNMQNKFTQCGVSPSSVTERVSMDVCEDDDLVRLMARYSCPDTLQAIMSSNQTFCRNFDKASDCISTGFSFYGQRCQNVRSTIYNMHTPLIYYLNSYDLCPSYNSPLGSPSSPTSSQIRLVGRSTPNQGRVEVYINGEWGTVCDDGFGTNDARVVCRMLGYSGGQPTYRGSAYYGQGTGRILLDNLGCTGNEESLLECNHNGIGNHDCGHHEDVGVQCPGNVIATTPAPTTRPDVEEDLMPSDIVSSDMVCQFFPIWSTSLAPCHSSFHQLMADSQCRAMEETVSCVQTELIKIGAFCNKRSVHDRVLSLLDENQRELCAQVAIDLTSVCNDGNIVTSVIESQCVGGQAGCASVWELTMCVHTVLDPLWERCSSFELETTIRDNVDSLPLTLCQDYDVRKTEDGRVLTYFNSGWFWLCADDWDQAEASVVCRHLGYTHGSPSLVPRVPGSVMVSEGVSAGGSMHVSCVGTESTLGDCTLDRVASCSKSHMAAVVCYNNTYTFELTNGHYGYVKLTRDEGEGHVCLPSVTNFNVQVLCREAGYSGGTALPAPSSPPPSGPMWRLDMECRSQTADANACLRPPYWRHEVTAEDDCQLINAYCYPSQARLHNGLFNSTGALLLYEGGSPTSLPHLSPVCRDDFTKASAAIFCRESGFPQGGQALPYNPFYLSPVFPPSYVYVACTGSETRMQDCPVRHSNWTDYCSGPAVVRCSVESTGVEEMSVKLAADNSQLLVYTGGQWGTLCADRWTNNEADVVCRQLGHLHGYTATSRLDHAYPHLLHEISCDVNDTSLKECTYQDVRTDVCQRVRPAAVSCTNSSRPVYSLRGGPTSNVGRLYASFEDVTAPVLTRYFGNDPASALCDSLGFHGGELYRGPFLNQTSDFQWAWRTSFGSTYECLYNSTELGFDVCRQTDLELLNCSSPVNESAMLWCRHARPVEIFCYPSAIRLHIGFSNTTGIIQKYNPLPYPRSWYEMCQSDVTQTAANVICRDVMASPTASAVIFRVPRNFFPVHSWRPRKALVTCGADDVTAAQCITVDSYRSCENSSDQSATVACYDGQMPNGSITGWRLADDGRVLVERYGSWGTVCGVGFDDTEANVICRHLGYTGGTALSRDRWGDRRPLWVRRISCSSRYDRLDYCTISPITDSDGYCRYWDARVRCYGSGGSTPYPYTTRTTTTTPTTPLPDTVPGPGGDTCGEVKNQPTSRIIGGNEAERGQFPWMIRLVVNGRGVCGGTIIDPTHVVTAAHCIDDLPKDDRGFLITLGRVEVIAGKHFTALLPSVAEQRVNVTSAIMHPDFRPQANDIAVMLLERPLQFNSRVASLCLPERFMNMPTHCIAAGWGYKSEAPYQTPDVLMHVTLQTYTTEQCRAVFARSDNIYGSDVKKVLHPGTMCAANGTSGGLGTCYGDSGGPLFCLKPDRSAYQLVGVSAWTFSGCHMNPRAPAGFTYVPYYRDFVDIAKLMLGNGSILQNNTCFSPNHPRFYDMHRCLSLVQSLPGLDINQTCSLVKESLDCVKARTSHYDSRCTTDVVRREVIQYLVSQLNTTSSFGLSAVELNITLSHCTGNSSGPDVGMEICEDTKLLAHIAASRVCYTPGQFPDNVTAYDTCLEIVPKLSECVHDVLNTSLQKRCDMSRLITGLTAQTTQLPQLLGMTSLNFEQCADFCPSFKPVILDSGVCLPLLTSSAASTSYSESTRCVFLTEAVRCMSMNLLLKDQPCSDERLHDVVNAYVKKTGLYGVPNATFCAATYPETVGANWACENPELLTGIFVTRCRAYNPLYERDCSRANLAATCVTRFLSESDVFCPTDVVLTSLAEHTFAVNISSECLTSENETEVLFSGLNCTGEDAKAAITMAGRKHCSFLLNRLDYLSDQTQRCSLSTDLLTCMTQAANYAGYHCSQADILRHNTSLLTSESLDQSCGGTVEAESAVGAVAQNVCLNHNLLKLYMDRLCSAAIAATLSSQNDSCGQFVEAADCVSTSLYTYNLGAECSDLKHTMYQLLTPTVYYVANLTSCLGTVRPAATDIRLVGSSVPYRGRVEVFINGRWGTVCDDSFGSSEAQVVCRMLGYEGTEAQALYSVASGYGPILLDDLGCTGRETHILDCRHRGIGVHDCGHSEDAGVDCSPASSSNTGTAGLSRVFPCRYFSPWDDVFAACHPTFSSLEMEDSCQHMDSAVQCAQASLLTQEWYCAEEDVFDRLLENFVGRHRQRHCAALRPLLQSYCYDDTIIGAALETCRPDNCRMCCSPANVLAQCVVSGMRKHNPDRSCDLYSMASVLERSNLTSDIICPDSAATLDEAGRVFVTKSGNSWQPMCGDLWTDTEATVLCREAGYAHGVASHRPIDYSAITFDEYSSTRWMSYAVCLGPERRLAECWMSSSRSCVSFHAAVRCYDHDYDFTLQPATPDVHYGPIQFSGDDGIGDICVTSEFGDREAHVLCRAAGYVWGVQRTQASDVMTQGPVWRLNMTCEGRAPDVSACVQPPYWQYDVSPDTGCSVPQVMCYDSKGRLHRHPSENLGLAQLYYVTPRAFDALPYFVCGDGFGDEEASVTCRGLGFSSGGQALTFNPFFPVHGGFSVACNGTENKLEDCEVSDDVIPCGGAAVVNCTREALGEDPVQTVKLSSDQREVLVYVQGQWGTICADHWTDSEADVVCKQLYNRSGVAAPAMQSRTYPHLLHQVRCNESQQHEELSQCGSQRLTTSQCEGTDAAGVFCFSDMLTYSLQGGDSANYGLVYVSNSSDNTAPALLHADLSPDLYDVLCRSLGYTGGEEYPGPLSPPGGLTTSLPVWRTQFRTSCLNQSTASTLELCRSDAWRRELCVSDPGNSSDTHCLDRAARAYCYTSRVRLHTGFRNTTGIVQFLQDGVWSEMCSSNLTQTTADVICRDILTSPTASAMILNVSNAYFERRVRDVPRKFSSHCTDEDITAGDCISVNVNSSCDYYQFPAAVICYDGAAPNGSITGWQVAADGRVMVERYGTWGTVCSGVSGYEATRICRRVGYQDGFATSRLAPNPRVPVWVKTLDCSSYDYTLEDCSIYFNSPSRFCTSANAAVSCFGSSTTTAATTTRPWWTFNATTTATTRSWWSLNTTTTTTAAAVTTGSWWNFNTTRP